MEAVEDLLFNSSGDEEDIARNNAVLEDPLLSNPIQHVTSQEFHKPPFG